MSDSQEQQSVTSNQVETEATSKNNRENANTRHTDNASQELEKRFRNSRLLALTTAIADLGVLIVGGLFPNLLYWSLCGVGIISFLGILILVNYTSQDPNFQKGEMRKAIAGSFIIVYFVILGVFVSSGFNPQQHSEIQAVIQKVMEPLSWLTGAIGAYYFGARSFEKFLGKK